MCNLNLKATVPQDRRLVLQLPDEIEPGEVTITIIPRRKPQKRTHEEFDFPTLHVKDWPKEWGTLRREDMYANIVATMLAYDIPQILTYNVEDFRRFSGFVEVAAEL